MKYIGTLREGERVGDIYLCKVKQTALTKAGKPYESLILQDKTGTLDAKIWDPNSQGIDEFEALDYIAVVGDVTSFQGAFQVNKSPDPLVKTIFLSLFVSKNEISGCERASFSINEVTLASSVESLFKYLSLAGVL